MFVSLGRYTHRLSKKTKDQFFILDIFVHDTFLQSELLNIFLAIPFVGVLLIALFRLDEIIAAPRRARAIKHPFNGCDEDGHLRLSDPDGRSQRTRPMPNEAHRPSSR
jgi:hypothetical protein